ncbi:SDR family NAD(P)-dependent oxidoreductase [Phytohabitans kaempferiae]|uniref:SDR family NAD(P)-dependent oxidoreductase n=1 Tax=Phytohabitans kaempferiae TaxID=1620943 RepID=A0ABV6M702_9ACTN
MTNQNAVRDAETATATASGADLAGKVAWITGAGRGLGRAIAVGLAAAGARVALTARSADQLKDVADEIDSRTGGPTLVLPGSVSDPAVVADHAARVVGELGRLDVLVNSAGISPSVVRSEHLTDADWQQILDINLTGTFYCCREAGRYMLAAGSGSIVNVSSVHGHTAVERMCAYAASKGGVELLTRTLSVEWADRGVRVNSLAPGYFRTQLTEAYVASRHGARVMSRIPMARIGETSELVGAAVFLAGDASSYVTGASLVVDGGWTAQ